MGESMISHCLGDAMRRFSTMSSEQRAAEITQIPETCGHADCTTGMGCRAYIASMLDAEQWRRVCEARGWLRRGYTRRPKVDALISQIGARRGTAAAERLREDMRVEWRRRNEWMEVAR